MFYFYFLEWTWIIIINGCLFKADIIFWYTMKYSISPRLIKGISLEREIPLSKVNKTNLTEQSMCCMGDRYEWARIKSA